MRTLTLPCPVCQTDLEFTEDDLDSLERGDILGCDACGSELEVVDTGQDFALEPLAFLTTCPRCAQEFELEEAELLAGKKLICPNCGFQFEPEWDDE